MYNLFDEFQDERAQEWRKLAGLNLQGRAIIYVFYYSQSSSGIMFILPLPPYTPPSTYLSFLSRIPVCKRRFNEI